MVRFMKGVHDDISQTFSNFYQGMVRSYHGTMPGVMFFKHLFHFLYSLKPNKQTFVVHYCHIFQRNIYPLFFVKGKYLAAVGGGYKLRKFDQTLAMEDAHLYTIKTFAYGTPDDNNAAKVYDLAFEVAEETP